MTDEDPITKLPMTTDEELIAAEAKLARAEWLLTDAMVQLEEGKIKTRRNRARLIREFLSETKGENK